MNIAIMCNAGMSSSLLVKGMQEKCALEGKDYTIASFPVTKVTEAGSWADIILVAPQIRHTMKMIRSHIPDKPIQAIDMRKYGMVDADGVLKDAELFAAEHDIPL